MTALTLLEGEGGDEEEPVVDSRFAIERAVLYRRTYSTLRKWSTDPAELRRQFAEDRALGNSYDSDARKAVFIMAAQVTGFPSLKDYNAIHKRALPPAWAFVREHLDTVGPYLVRLGFVTEVLAWGSPQFRELLQKEKEEDPLQERIRQLKLERLKIDEELNPLQTEARLARAERRERQENGLALIQAMGFPE